MASPKENLLYILLPGLRKKVPKSPQEVFAYADTEVLSPRPVKAPTFYESVLNAADIGSAAREDACAARRVDDDFPAPPTAEDWARMEPDLSWDECVRRAEACGTHLLDMPRGLDVATPAPAAASPTDKARGGAITTAVISSTLLQFKDVHDPSPTDDIASQGEDNDVDDDTLLAPSPEVSTEKLKSDKAMVEWMFDVLLAMIQMGALLHPSVNKADPIQDQRNAILVMLDILQHTAFPAPAPILALWYIHELAIDTQLLGTFFHAICADGPCTIGEFIVRMFCAGMMLADNMLNDHTYNLKTWSLLSDLPTSLLFKMQITSLTVLGHNLTISPQAWEIHLGQLIAQNTLIIKAQCDSQVLPSSVVVGSLLRDLLASAKVSSSSAEPLFLGEPAPTSSVAYLELLWAGRVSVPNIVAVVQRNQISFTYAHSAHSRSGANRARALELPIKKTSFHKRKASSSPEWSTAGDALATPITRKAARTMKASAVGAERERIVRAQSICHGPQWGSVCKPHKKQTTDWGIVQPWNAFRDIQPTRHFTKASEPSSAQRPPVRLNHFGNRNF